MGLSSAGLQQAWLNGTCMHSYINSFGGAQHGHVSVNTFACLCAMSLRASPTVYTRRNHNLPLQKARNPLELAAATTAIAMLYSAALRVSHSFHQLEKSRYRSPPLFQVAVQLVILASCITIAVNRSNFFFVVDTKSGCSFLMLLLSPSLPVFSRFPGMHPWYYIVAEQILNPRCSTRRRDNFPLVENMYDRTKG